VSNGPVKPANYKTCICGKVCKGRSALQTHGRKCPAERVRSALCVWLACNGKQQVSDAFVLNNLPVLAKRLVELGALHGSPIEGMVTSADVTATNA
jgi:hypothetical protein